jgi:hypothetical protein
MHLSQSLVSTFHSRRITFFDMRKVISINEVADSAENWQGKWEICATADGVYDEQKSELRVKLGCFARPTDARLGSGGVELDWLPRTEAVKESVPLDEAIPLVKDIFQPWLQKVRQTIASLVAS